MFNRITANGKINNDNNADDIYLLLQLKVSQRIILLHYSVSS